MVLFAILAIVAGANSYRTIHSFIDFQRHVAIDGKTLRRSFDNFLDRRAAHILSAFASDKALVLGHLECDEKSNEIPAVQTLLASLALTGSVVTVDAMHCQKKHYVDGSRLAMPLCY